MSEHKSSIEVLFKDSLDDAASSRLPADPSAREPEPTPEKSEIRPSGKRIPVADDMEAPDGLVALKLTRDPKADLIAFVPFKRLESKDEVPRSGWGLAIGRRIAERHAGTIQVASQSEVGVTFSFSIPRGNHTRP